MRLLKKWVNDQMVRIGWRSLSAASSHAVSGYIRARASNPLPLVAFSP
jgi:hypothetical protein